MTSKKIYVASSWRNDYQQHVVAALRGEGHQVYDFKNPKDGEHGFSWSAIDPNWKSWTPEQFKKALQHPIARKGHQSDHDAMVWCDTCVLVLPCGSSAHLEAGWCAGRGKNVLVYAPALREPELMYHSLTDSFEDRDNARMFCTSMEEMFSLLKAAVTPI